MNQLSQAAKLTTVFKPLPNVLLALMEMWQSTKIVKGFLTGEVIPSDANSSHGMSTATSWNLRNATFKVVSLA